MAGIEIIEAVAGQKNKASNYNENFNRMKAYIEASMEENEENTQSYVQQQLTTYSNINTLATSGTIALTANSINKIIPTGNVTFTLPTITDNTKFYQILVQANLTNTSYIVASRLGASKYFNCGAPAFSEPGQYNIIYEYDSTSNNWVVGAVKKGV